MNRTAVGAEPLGGLCLSGRTTYVSEMHARTLAREAGLLPAAVYLLPEGGKA